MYSCCLESQPAKPLKAMAEYNKQRKIQKIDAKYYFTQKSILALFLKLFIFRSMLDCICRLYEFLAKTVLKRTA